MKNWFVISLMIFVCLPVLSAPSQEAFGRNYDRVMELSKSGQWGKLLESGSLAELRKLSADERFKIADSLMQEQLLSRDIFYTAKNRPTHLTRLIESNKTTPKEKEMFRLSLYLVSDILINP